MTGSRIPDKWFVRLPVIKAMGPLRAVLVDVPSGRALSAVVDVPPRGLIRLPVLAPSGYARVEVRMQDGTPVAWFNVEAEVVVDNSVAVDLSRISVTDA